MPQEGTVIGPSRLSGRLGASLSGGRDLRGVSIVKDALRTAVNAIRDGPSGRWATSDVRGLVASAHKLTDDARHAAKR